MQAETVKKPYAAPKLVVMGTAEEMTQSVPGAFDDDAFDTQDEAS